MAVNKTIPMVRTRRLIVWLAILVLIFHRPSTFAAAVGDQVELKATH